MKDMKKKVIAAGVAALLVGAGAGVAVGFALDNPSTIVQKQIVTKEVPVNVPVVEYVNVTHEVPVNVTVEVPVDNGNLAMVLDHIYDNNGDIEYITDDLDDDEVNMIVDRVMFVDESKALSVDAVKNEFLNLIDKEDFNGTNKFFDEDDVERVRVQGDADEVIVSDIDWDDSDAEVLVEARFEQDDVKYKAFVLVDIKDGEVDDLNVDSIELR